MRDSHSTCSDVNYLASSEIGFLMTIKRRIDRRQGKVVMFGVGAYLLDIFRTMNLTKIIDIVDRQAGGAREAGGTDVALNVLAMSDQLAASPIPFGRAGSLSDSRTHGGLRCWQIRAVKKRQDQAFKRPSIRLE